MPLLYSVNKIRCHHPSQTMVGLLGELSCVCARFFPYFSLRWLLTQTPWSFDTTSAMRSITLKIKRFLHWQISLAKAMAFSLPLAGW